MAVDGTNSPAHQHTEARTVKSEARDSCSPDEAMVPCDDINVDIKPNISPIAPSDDRQQNVQLPTTSSLTTETGNYYFGESHVTRLESFVESMTGLSGASHPSRLDNHWSTSLEKSNGISVSSRKSALTNTSDLVGNLNQPLDLSVKSSGHSRRTFDDCGAPLRFSGKRTKNGDDTVSSNMAAAAIAAAAAGAVAGFPASAYPTLADMWLAHWLNMATVASNMFPHLPLNMPTSHHLLSGLSPPLGIKTSSSPHHVSSDRHKMSPFLHSSMMESPQSSSNSSLLSCPTPGKVGSAVTPTCLQDGVINTSSSYSDIRRRRDVTSDVTSSQPSTSAFSLFYQNGDRKDGTLSDTSMGIGGASRGNTVAALSAIESFVENSFTRENNSRTAAMLSRDIRRHDSSPLLAAVKRSRRFGDDHMTSSGDEETVSCNGAERARGFSGKRRRMQQSRKPEAAHQRRSGEDDSECKLSRNSLPMRQSSSDDIASSPVDYLPCLTYERPANTKHPLECLERLVHIQSNARRSAHLQEVSVTSPGIPSSTSNRRSRNGAASPSSGATNDRIETVGGGDDHVTCSSSVDGVTSVLPVGTFRNPTTASLLLCNM